MPGPEIITPNTQKQQVNPIEQIMLSLLNSVNVLTMQVDSLFEIICDTEEKKQAFKKLMDAKIQAYKEKVKSAQIKQKIMQK